MNVVEETSGEFNAILADILSVVEKHKARVPDRTLLAPDLEQVENAYLKASPQLKVGSSLSCPKCGDTNASNLMNGKPYCFKCRVHLTSKGKKSSIKEPDDKWGLKPAC